MNFVFVLTYLFTHTVIVFCSLAIDVARIFNWEGGGISVKNLTQQQVTDPKNFGGGDADLNLIEC